MPFEIHMPMLSPTMQEGAIARWCKKEGDVVERAATSCAKSKPTKQQWKRWKKERLPNASLPMVRRALPYADNLETLALPQVEDIVRAVRTVCS